MTSLPTAGDLHVNRALTNVLIANVLDKDDFVGMSAFPRNPVSKQSDIVAKYDKGDFLRDDVRVRAPGAVAAEAGFRTDLTQTYFAPQFALRHMIPDDKRDNQDDPFNLDRDATIFLSQKMRISMDADWATKAFTTGIWLSDTPVATVWSNPLSTPVKDISTRRRTVKDGSGFMPNVLVVNGVAWDALRDHPELIERVKGTGANDAPAMMTRRAVAEVMELDEILVAEGVRNTAPEGATATVSQILGNNALLMYRAPRPSMLLPSAGYTHLWKSNFGGEEGMRVKRYRNEDRESDVVEVQAWWDFTVTGSDLGVFIPSVA